MFICVFIRKQKQFKMAKVTIGFRTEPEIKNELLEKANELGISLSDYCENLIVNRRNNVDDNGFREPMLTEGDVDIIEEVFADQLHEYFGVNGRKFLREKEDSNPPEAKITDLEDFFDFLDLPEENAKNLANYLKKAAKALEVNEAEILVKMLAFTYSELAPIKGGVFNRGIGGISSEKIFE